jgi:hypothetical protein
MGSYRFPEKISLGCHFWTNIIVVCMMKTFWWKTLLALVREPFGGRRCLIIDNSHVYISAKHTKYPNTGRNLAMSTWNRNGIQKIPNTIQIQQPLASAHSSTSKAIIAAIN